MLKMRPAIVWLSAFSSSGPFRFEYVAEGVLYNCSIPIYQLFGLQKDFLLHSEVRKDHHIYFHRCDDKEILPMFSLLSDFLKRIYRLENSHAELYHIYLEDMQLDHRNSFPFLRGSHYCPYICLLFRSLRRVYHTVVYKNTPIYENLVVSLRTCVHAPQGFQRGGTPWHTDFGAKSSVLHIVRDVQAPGTHVCSDCPRMRHIARKAGYHRHDDTLPLLVPVLVLYRPPQKKSPERMVWRHLSW